MASFTWPYDANTVHISGSWDQWTERIPLTKDAKNIFHTAIPLETGEYEYKFIVDERRWCYDILKPTRADDRGNRNNVILVGRGQSAPPKGKEQQHHAKEEAPKKEHQGKEQHQHSKEEAPKKEQPAEQKGGGKKEKQPQQQQQQKKGGEQQKPEGGEKQGKVSAAARAASQKVISTVKSYDAPWFVADVDIEDNLADVIATANLFGQALPDSACMFLSGGQKTFIIVALVPPSKSAGASAIELINTALTVLANPPDPEGNNNLAHAVVQADPDKGIFPLKLKDLTRGPVFSLLKKRGLVKDEEEDDDDLPAWDF